MSTSRIIEVPDLSAAELIARAKCDFESMHLDANLASWDFIQDERGKKYEVMEWYPQSITFSSEVLSFFKSYGFDGNTAAFIAWIIERKPKGYYVSIPANEDRLFRGQSNARLDAPASTTDGGPRLYLCSVRLEWSNWWSFVAFRQITS